MTRLSIEVSVKFFCRGCILYCYYIVAIVGDSPFLNNGGVKSNYKKVFRSFKNTDF